jgi:hypothetical protein
VGSGLATVDAAVGAEGDTLVELDFSVSVLIVAGYLHQGLRTRRSEC